MDRIGENEELVFSMKPMNRCFLWAEENIKILVYLKRKCVVDRNPSAGGQCWELNLQTTWGEGVGQPEPHTPDTITVIETVVVEHVTPTIHVVVPEPALVDPFAVVEETEPLSEEENTSMEE